MHPSPLTAICWDISVVHYVGKLYTVMLVVLYCRCVFSYDLQFYMLFRPFHKKNYLCVIVTFHHFCIKLKKHFLFSLLLSLSLPSVNNRCLHMCFYVSICVNV